MNELTATILVGVFGITGSLIVLASALAMFRVRDALSRINVFSPATGLGLPLIALAAYVSDLYVEGFSVTSLLVLLATILCLIIVSSVASNTLSRASVLSGQPIYRKTSPNRLAQPPEGIEDPDPADAEPVTKDDRSGPNG
ncbi:cation:proton antiporter [Brevibacterium casei]|uniref:cation:proton antiporter n=2 Tax=Bacteria TaxID=2 RepID=UPI0021AFD030|nr:monovalent cation/H(+) antiporter subunit G [Brevibacterium casei]MCT1766630.1 monovalent cation/H(+) antiporter subunit G [Brevibacterium casei]MCT2182997.1 monovalent cation/H(+) antiporter subunit G [Brevibacterium casei]MCT2358434.1 monovalent cation/H(+) antiporter subunit G [Brevibacterium casei]